MGETYLTKEGLKKIQEEFKTLQKQRLGLLEEVNQAAAMGDLRENAEYHAARERLAHVSMRLSDLEGKLMHVRLIEGVAEFIGEARLGTEVALKDLTTKEKFAYVLVGPEEADPQTGKLSIDSPLGKSLLGKKKGEKFMLNLPRTTVPYQVMNVKRSS